MKTLSFALFTVLFSFTALASATLEPKALISKFEGKTGAYYKDGIADGSCIVYNYSADGFETVMMETPNAYDANASFDLPVTSSKLKGGVASFNNSETGKRPGGDSCGDMGGSVGYSKSLVITDEVSVTIIEKFRCITEALKKTVLTSECRF